jgi:hypothetical protein
MLFLLAFNLGVSGSGALLAPTPLGTCEAIRPSFRGAAADGEPGTQEHGPLEKRW